MNATADYWSSKLTEEFKTLAVKHETCSFLCIKNIYWRLLQAGFLLLGEMFILHYQFS